MILKNISKAVWLLSFVSLFNDLSSEMLYPILPLYLQQAGYGGLAIGILEGIAEFIAGFSKIYLGRLSDLYGKRLPFIQLGYFLSVISRPILGLIQALPLLVTARSFDRIGKGIRTAARDAMLADESTEETRAEVFGFHRSMDTLGAVLGPLTALTYLHFHPEDYRTIFLITFLPGILAIVLTRFIPERKITLSVTLSSRPKWSQIITFYKQAPKKYLSWLVLFLMFSLVNSSDMFLLLQAKQVGFSETKVLVCYIVFNLSYTLFSYPIGLITNKIGKINIFVYGVTLFATTYILFGFLNSSWVFLSQFLFLGFILYGLFYACTQGATKTILLSTVSGENKASAIGLFEGLNSFAMLVANIVAGIIWFRFGGKFLFLGTGFIVLLILLLLILNRKKIN